MSKSFKFKNNMYLDTKGIVHNKQLLSDILNKFYGFEKKYYAGKTLNCNEIVSSGVYIIDINNTITNRPTKVVNDIEALIVIETNKESIVLQIWFNYNNALYYRWKWWGNWGPWKQITIS